MRVAVVTHCWNQDMITYEKLLFSIWESQMNEMKYYVL